VFFDSGDTDKALAEFTKAIEAKRVDARRYMYRAAAYSKKGQFPKAIVDLNEAIRLDPKDAVAYEKRGVAFGQLGFFEKAVSDLTESLRLDANGASAVNALINRGFPGGPLPRRWLRIN
jgi:Flp pilus assembly protein TadD